MAEVTLADYTGYIFLEMVKARQMADVHSAALAIEYAKDPVLKHFSVPRFKIPRMELTIPVLISGAQFNQTVVFGLKEDEFVGLVFKLLNEALRILAAESGDTSAAPPQLGPQDTSDGSAVIGDRSRNFWAELRDHPDLATSTVHVSDFWRAMFKRALEATRMDDAVRKNPKLFEKLIAQPPEALLAALKNAAVVSNTRVQSLLINPQTNDVKNGSSDATVFTIKAEMLEEGFYVRTMKDEATGQQTQVVEFE